MRQYGQLFIIATLATAFLGCTPKEQILKIEGGNIKVVASEKQEGAAKVRDILASASMAVDSIRRPVIGYAAHDLEKRIPESPLMNFAADALLATAREHTGEHIDIAITNKGGLRSNIQAGTITFGDIYNVFPFDNTLALLTLDGAQLLQLCREIAAVGGEAVSGIQLVITPQRELVSATVGGKPIEPSGRYRIATSDYLAQGNDRMSSLASGTERDIKSDVTIRDLMVKYIKGLAAKGMELDAECDGRITVKD